MLDFQYWTINIASPSQKSHPLRYVAGPAAGKAWLKASDK
jgi:hypothetical protein